MTDLYRLLPEEMEKMVIDMGQLRYRADQILYPLYYKFPKNISELKQLSTAMLDKLIAITVAIIAFILIPGLWVVPFSVAWFAPGALIYQWKEMIAAFLVIGIVLLAGLIYVIYPSRHSTNISKGTVIMALFLFTIIACLGLFLASMVAFGK